jgi:ubiquinone/menaquinone biosynthesis C-methylase UbiE
MTRRKPALAEFTGERVIPNLVDPNLLNEHLARYRFAARFCKGVAVLDAGCGTGYGTAELADAASVTATDISEEALDYARENFGRPGVHFINAPCEALPFGEAAFDLITAFEVIEHLKRWPDLLTEARRVLAPAGVLLVSTPNKAYYAEMRSKVGPNPFHCHEFEYEEFRSALSEVFPHVRIWAQNRAEAIVFAPAAPRKSVLEAPGDHDPENAHFFLAACSQSPLEADDVFAWLPSSGNVLRERELHIAKLEGEIARKDKWLDELKASHAALQKSHEATLDELRERALWARQLNTRIDERNTVIKQLQAEAETRVAWVRNLERELADAGADIDRLMAREAELQADLQARTGWALALEAKRTEHVRQLLVENDVHKHQVEELNALRLRHTDEIGQLRARQAMIAQSRWVRLGRSLNVGPVVPGPEAPVSDVDSE